MGYLKFAVSDKFAFIGLNFLATLPSQPIHGEPAFTATVSATSAG